MKTKSLLGFVGAILVAFLAINLATATLNVNIDEISVNDVSISGSSVLTLSGAPKETVPITVKFTANKDLDDLKLKAWIDGYKSDISASSSRFNVINGSTYIKRLSLVLPSSEDLDGLNEKIVLHVRIADKTEEIEAIYNVRVERDSYVVEVLSVEMPNKASAGEIIALDIVLKNRGTEEIEDAFVVARIPELGIQRKVYFGDLTPEDDPVADKDDARERRLYLTIPANVKTGDYDVEVKAYNYDATEVIKKVLSVTGTAVKEDSEDAEEIKDNKEGKMSTSIVVLTVVLVIIFVVLLVVLVVLLTKKPSEKTEDFGETSYY
jgi:hypothetical protein